MRRMIAVFVGVLACAWAATAAQVRLLFDDGREPVSIGAAQEGPIVYASVRDLAKVFDLETRWRPETQKLIVLAGRVQAKFVAWDPIAIVDDIPYNLPAPPIIQGGTLLVPAGALVRLLDPITPGALSWDAQARAFRLSTAYYNVRPGTIEQRENGTFVTIRVPGDLPIEEETGEPNWLHLTILGGHIDARAFRQMPLGGAVLQILAFQYQNSAQLSFRIERGYRYELMRGTQGGWLMILFRRVMPLPEPLSQLGEVIEVDSSQWAINTIIVDPGHGGRDPGTVGPGDLYEKDIVLAIARRLAERLRDELHVNVVLTRTDDRFVSLRERGRIATRNGGKLFISIHCNANADPRLGGVETYFLSDAKTEEARRVARMENAALRYEFEEEPTDVRNGEYDWRDVDEILMGMTSNRFLRESQELAKLVQRELVRSLGVRDMGVHQAEFYVMKGTLASMPSILAEVGYLSNPAEARKLRQRSYQRRIADAIFRAVREFKLKYEREL